MDVTLSWDPPTTNADGTPLTDLAGYKVYYDTDSGPPYTGDQANEGPSPIDVPLSSLPDPTAPSIELSGLPSCQTFYFATTAYDTSGNESTFSDEVSAVLVAAPAPIGAESDGNGGVRVAWGGLPSDDEGSLASYRLNYDFESGPPYEGVGAEEGDSPITIAMADLEDPSMPSFTLGGLPDQQMVYLTVEAVCADGSAAMSDEVSAVVKVLEPSCADGGGCPDGGADGGTGARVVEGEGGCGCTSSGVGGGGWVCFVLLGALVAGLRRRPGSYLRARARRRPGP